MVKKSFWSQFTHWNEAEAAWDEGAKKAAQEHPLRVLTTLPSMPGISKETAQGLKWKSLRWMIAQDKNWAITRHVVKRPIKHFFRFIKSLFKKKSYVRDGDFFLYGMRCVTEFTSLLQDPDSLFAVGFSYCEKPHECPSGRFTPECIHDENNPVCRQCFIGKAVHALPETRTYPLFIPTIHYIGQKMFELIEAHPKKKILFLITACEMTLEMFGDYGNMAGLQGIGVRLDGRICNTMKAFELSEKGTKPGLTVVVGDTQKRILEILAFWRDCQNVDENR